MADRLRPDDDDDDDDRPNLERDGNMGRILIMTGEASGDQHGAKLAEALRSLDPNAELIGLGGARMLAAGVRMVEGIDRLDIIGIPSLAELRQAWRTYRALTRRLRELELDAVVLIDNPGLNLRLARVAKAAGHRVIYFVAPQIWAWNRRRIETIRRVVDLVLVILPFEVAIYRDAGVRCQFVGHPLLDDIQLDVDRGKLRADLGLTADGPVVGLLPGSRERETGMLLPIMLQAAELLTAAHRDAANPITFLLGEASSLRREHVEAMLAGSTAKVRVVRDRTFDVMAACNILFVASGTATLQSAVIGTPMVIVYRAAPVTAFLARMLIKVRWLGLANLVAECTIATELLQSDCTAPRLAAEAERIFADENARHAAETAARELRSKLGARGAAMRAAQAILAECRGDKSG